ncbi:MAG: HAD family hydrolase [Opitutales bacterium]
MSKSPTPSVSESGQPAPSVPAAVRKNTIGSAAPFQSSRGDALRRIREAPPGTVLLIDFDETLMLTNSTQTYVRAARPYLFSAIFFGILEKLKPWRIIPTPGDRWQLMRDWVRMLAVCFCFPWTLQLWKRKAKQIADEWGNRPLIEALRQRPDCRLVITSYGWRALLRPILREMDLPPYELDSCRLRHYRHDRLRGKPVRLRELVGDEALKQALLITDSPDDLDLAAEVGHTCLLQWDPPSSAPIFSHYVPFLYSVKAKYGNWGHIRSVILADEFPLLVLCLSWLAQFPLLHAAGVFLLVLSYWIIYELGYMENDYTAEKKEKNPNLSDNYTNNRDRISFVEPWFWGVLLAIPALLLIELAKPTVGGPWGYDVLPDWPVRVGGVLESSTLWLKLLQWSALLFFVWGIFWVYNRIDKFSRTWLYLPMQFTKNFGFALVTPLSFFGYLVFAVHGLARWVTYFIYRFGRETYPGTSWFQRIRFFLLLSFAAMALFLPTGVESVLTWQALVITAWLGLRARPFLWESLRGIRRVSRDTWSLKKKES